MKAWVWIVLVAGCLGGVEQSIQAKEAADASHSSAMGEFDYLLFLGITGTEGPLNWTLYEEALRVSSDPGRSIAEAFDQDVDNGELGDGGLGSWLSTHFVFDEKKRLLGGLYTQYTAEHGLRTVYAPFRGPYAGTVALPGLQQSHLPMLDLVAQEENGTVLCGLVSHTDDWEVDSEEAAAIARSRPIMADHIEAQPEGEFTYYYFPRLDVEPGCPAALDVDSNHWLISHADLDTYLEGGDPTIVEVRIDAATGEVLSESVRPLFSRPPVVLDEVIAYTDPLLELSPATHNVTLPVKQGAKYLDLQAVRTESPEHERRVTVRVLDPDGRVADERSFDPAYWFHAEAPVPGDWVFQYVHEPLEPYGRHEVQIRAVVHYT